MPWLELYQAIVMMHDKPVGRGYVQLAENQQHPWPHTIDNGIAIRAHEFHYSSLEEPAFRFKIRLFE